MNDRTQPGAEPRDGMRNVGSTTQSPPVQSPPVQPSMGDDVSGRAADHATDLASDASKAATTLQGDIKDVVTSLSRAMKEQASELASGIGKELGKTAEDQKTRGVDTMACFARAITSAAAEFEDQSPRVAQSVRDAAKKVESLSSNLSTRNVDELMKVTTDLARSQPLLFVGGAMAAGFALSRFLKSGTPGPGSSVRSNMPVDG